MTRRTFGLPELPDALAERRDYDLNAPTPAVRVDTRGALSPDRPHTHNAAQVSVCLSGGGWIRVGRLRHAFRTGSALIVPPELPHALEEGGGASYASVYVDEERLLRELPAQYAADVRALFGQAREMKGLLLDAGAILQGLTEAVEALARCHRDGVRAMEAYGQLLVLLGRILELPARALEAAPEEARKGIRGSGDADTGDGREAPGAQWALILPAVKYVGEHYAREIRAADMAAKCALSESHFRKLFVRLTGMPPMDFVSRVRVSRALFLLRSTDDTVLEIAGRTGFSSIATFNRNFRRYVGQTPGAWRRDAEGAEADLRLIPFM